LLTTEATYPYVMGGVSSWCDLLVHGIDTVEWRILPIVAGGVPREPLFKLPPHARVVPRVEIWSEMRVPIGVHRLASRVEVQTGLPGILARELLSPEARLGPLVSALVSCRLQPSSIRRAFRSAQGWKSFVAALSSVMSEESSQAGSSPLLGALDAALLYQMLYWVARTAAAPAPQVDVSHVTAAGWAVIPALVNQALHGTPLLLTEHGVYVREAYLAAARTPMTAASRFIATRLARGLTRAAYAAADVISPVSDANAVWERSLGVDSGKIEVIYNGVRIPGTPAPPPRKRRVVSVGRIDPLKDVHTMLRVAADVAARLPDVEFRHYGPVTEGQEAYGRSCYALLDALGLGDRFRFMGRTTDANGVVRDADVVLMTSISEGLPLSILEAMAQARPVVATGVGGVPDLVRGCGMVAPPGDVHALGSAVTALLVNPVLADRLGHRGYARVRRRFTEEACLDSYRALLNTLANPVAA